MSHYVTTHNNDGQATFCPRIQPSSEPIQTPIGTMNILSTTWSSNPDLSTEADIDQYSIDRAEGLGMKICPENGTATAIISLPPNIESPDHRTMTLDVVFVLEGKLELHLDSGEKRVMTAGDSVVQRATMHKWVNVTPNDGWAKMLGFAQSIVEPVRAGGKELKAEFHVPSA